MNYYPFHVGDYAVHTRHLTLMEDLAYRRLLDLYYTRESALQGDVPQIARLVGMREFAADVESVLTEFFVRSDGGWGHERCDLEIAKMQDKQAKAQASAQASVNARKAKLDNKPITVSTDVERPFSDRSATVELPTPTPTPTPTSEEKGEGEKNQGADAPTPPEIPESLVLPNIASKSKAAVQPVQKPQPIADIPEALMADFLAIRRAKKLPLTQTAITGIRREAEKSGLTMTEAVTACCEYGWGGFDAAWYANRKRDGPGIGTNGPAGFTPGMNRQEALEASNRSVLERFRANQNKENHETVE